MTSTVRYATIFNTTGAVFTPSSPNALVTTGLDGSLRTFRRSFAAIDIGTEKGKTRDATDPTLGCLLFSISGSKIKRVTSFQLFRPATITTNQFIMNAGDDTNSVKIGWRIVNDEGISSLYLYDGGTGSARIAENDFIEVLIAAGNQDPA